MENLKVVINLYFDDERYFYQFFYVTAWDVQYQLEMLQISMEGFGLNLFSIF